MNRRAKNRVFKGLACLAIFVCAIILLFLFGVIFWKGIQAISIDFILTPASNFGASGGIWYQLMGSLLLIFCAAIISFPLAIGTALYKSEYIKNEKWQRISSLFLYLLNGVPSVILGVFGLIFFVNMLGTGISWFVGAVILAIMMLPTITLAAYQSFHQVPTIYRESAQGLGMSKVKVITKVVIPQGINGAVTGLLLGMARIIGETAPIMFIATAFSGVTLPTSLVEPIATLPTHILALAQQATNPKALQNAWGASFVLVLMVLLFSCLGLYFRIKHHKRVHQS